MGCLEQEEGSSGYKGMMAQSTGYGYKRGTALWPLRARMQVASTAGDKASLVDCFIICLSATTDRAASFAFPSYWFRSTSVSGDGTAHDTVRAPTAKEAAQVFGALEVRVGTAEETVKICGKCRHNLLSYPGEV